MYAAGDVARWCNPLFGTSMRIEHRTNAAEQGMAAARNLLRPAARKPFAPVPYFFLAGGRFVAAYRTGERVSGALAVGMPPRAPRPWRQAIAAGTGWDEAVCAGATAPGV